MHRRAAMKQFCQTPGASNPEFAIVDGMHYRNFQAMSRSVTELSIQLKTESLLRRAAAAGAWCTLDQKYDGPRSKLEPEQGPLLHPCKRYIPDARAKLQSSSMTSLNADFFPLGAVLSSAGGRSVQRGHCTEEMNQGVKTLKIRRNAVSYATAAINHPTDQQQSDDLIARARTNTTTMGRPTQNHWADHNLRLSPISDTECQPSINDVISGKPKLSPMHSARSAHAKRATVEET